MAATTKPKTAQKGRRNEEPEPMTTEPLDLSDPELRERIRRECRLLAESADEREVMEWLDAVRSWPPDEPSMADYSDDEPAKK